MKSSNIAILFSLILLSPQVVMAFQYEPKSLNLIAYRDGYVHVEYRISVSPETPSISVSLLGSMIEDLIVTDEKDTLLDYTINDSLIEISTLGATEARIDYSTPTLTNKTGTLWTVSLTAPCNFTITLPENATVVDLSDAPISLTTQGERLVISMNAGSQEISYLIQVSEAGSAARSIGQAREAIRLAESEGRTEGLQEAEQLLSQALDAYNKGQYASAESLAFQARARADQASTPAISPTPPYTSLVLAAIFIVALLSAALILRRTRRSRQATKEEAALHMDDLQVLNFLREAGRPVTESEIREKFRELPKTTVWRIVKRLEERGFVEVRKVGGQNRISLR